jgi:hypothetical protein
MAKDGGQSPKQEAAPGRHVGLLGIFATALTTMLVSIVGTWGVVKAAGVGASSSSRGSESSIRAENERAYRQEFGTLADRLLGEKDIRAQLTVRRLESVYRETSDSDLRQSILEVLADHVRRRAGPPGKSSTLSSAACQHLVVDRTPVDIEGYSPASL